jgi:hypothetical protein
MAELTCHKVALEATLKLFGEGFSFGESKGLQQFYGTFFFRDNSPVAYIPEKTPMRFRFPKNLRR